MKTFIFIFLQYITPQHALSRFAGWVAESRITWLKSFIITKFIRVFGVNMEEARNSDPESYTCFNDFFCRALKDDARPITDGMNTLACPADGAVSQVGDIQNGRIFQAKGRDFSAQELLGGCAETAATFTKGSFTTIYLSPKDYHRLHMPLDGKLISMIHVPGDLFSVNPATAENVPKLFARNERVVCLFETEIGPVALVLVGAMIVASIETTWAGLVAPTGKQVSTVNYNAQPIDFKKGDEFARFKLGSTIVMLFPEDTVSWSNAFSPATAVQMGQDIGEFKTTA